MGYWDEYCLVCGGPPGDVDLEDLAEQVRNGQNATALGTASPEWVVKTLLEMRTKQKWLTEWAGVDSAENLIELGTYSGQGDFATNDGGAVFNVVQEVPGQRSGIAFHRSCGAVLTEQLAYQPRYGDIFHRLLVHEEPHAQRNLLMGIDYGPILRCHEQDFDNIQLIIDGNDWMLEDPRLDSRSRDRIVTMWRPFVRFLGHRAR